MKRFSKAIKALAATLAVAIAVTCFTPAPVFAAKTITTTKTWEKAKAINKSGSTTVKYKTYNNHYFKFVAPKKGKYTITFDNLKTKTPGHDFGHVSISKVVKSPYSGKLQIVSLPVKTEGNKQAYSLYIATKKDSIYRTKCTAKKISLNKGDTLVFYFHSTGKTPTMRVNVKKN